MSRRLWATSSFNPRPRAAGDPVAPPISAQRGSFNPRPRAAGDPTAISYRKWLVWFQSTPARGGRLPRDRIDSTPRVCFNPRPRAAGDLIMSERSTLLNRVSIHARARRATMANCWTMMANEFQSTPARGGRPLRTPIVHSLFSFNPRPRAAGDIEYAHTLSHTPGFNPRPRAAGDLEVFDSQHRDAVVSIHASARRATSNALRPNDLERCFNPRPRAAGDLETEAMCRRCMVFQSTPARGGRRELGDIGFRVPGFQSTPARGGRLRGGGVTWYNVSIHARARRATSASLRRDTHTKFQSTPARGGRLCAASAIRIAWEFQSTPARGGRPPES